MGVQMLNMTFQLSGFILCLMGILQLLVGPKLKGRAERYLFRFFIFLLLYNASNLLGQAFRGAPGRNPRAVLMVVNFLEYAFPLALIYCMSQYLIDLTDSQKTRPNFLKIQRIFILCHLVLLTVSQFTEFLYRIDAQNIYQRGKWFPLAFLFPLLMMFMDMYVLVVDRSKLTRREKFAFWIYLLAPTVAMILQSSFYGIYLVFFSTVVSALTIFIVLRMDEMDRYYAQEKENANLKINILLSQIQPHFIYNALYVIQQLCMTDSQAAGKAIGWFIQYLRHNMDSITMDTPIPFEEELKHAQSYVNLQQLRFGEKLQVSYDLQVTDFKIPTLTLQPIVENAVHYGVRKTSSGEGTVSISTREKPDCYEITVKDNGPGFVPESPLGDKESSRVGLKNARERLARISNGELKIETKLGKGTTVTLIIPKASPEGEEGKRKWGRRKKAKKAKAEVK